MSTQKFNFITKLIYEILQTFLPEHCISCKEPLVSSLSGFCEKCIKSLTYVNYSDICPYCFSKKGEFTFHNCIKNTHISRNISTFEFSKDIQEFIHEVKYSYRKKLLKNFLKRKITAINLYGETPDLILPVPLHKHKMLQRGFNQSQIIAEHTARILSIPCSLDILYREKDTAAQSTLDEDKRSENVKNAFAVYSNKKELIKGKCVMIIDDVMTTGNTLAECADVLKEAGANKIISYTLIRA